MPHLRRALGPIAAAWLFVQLGLMLVPAFVFSAGTADARLECTCAHGDHTICAMHHKAASAATVCLMRSAHNSGAVLIRSVYTFVAVLAAPTQSITPPPDVPVVHTISTPSSRRSAPPDPPPPRA